MKVLVVEDDRNIIKEISFYLQVRYPDVIVIPIDSGLKGLQMIETETPDLVMLDSSLPDMDHLELVKQIRNFSHVPLIALSHLESDLDRARSLETGSDDCISKPLNPIEMLARIKALLRRCQGIDVYTEQPVSINKELSINFNTREVFRSGIRVKLTPIEYKLLLELVRSEGKILTHRAILEKVWGDQFDADASFVKKYIYRLRCKLFSNGNSSMLVTERGIGYKLIKHIQSATYANYTAHSDQPEQAIASR